MTTLVLTDAQLDQVLFALTARVRRATERMTTDPTLQNDPVFMAAYHDTQTAFAVVAAAEEQRENDRLRTETD